MSQKRVKSQSRFIHSLVVNVTILHKREREEERETESHKENGKVQLNHHERKTIPISFVSTADRWRCKPTKLSDNLWFTLKLTCGPEIKLKQIKSCVKRRKEKKILCSQSYMIGLALDEIINYKIFWMNEKKRRKKKF